MHVPELEPAVITNTCRRIYDRCCFYDFGDRHLSIARHADLRSGSSGQLDAVDLRWSPFPTAYKQNQLNQMVAVFDNLAETRVVEWFSSLAQLSDFLVDLLVRRHQHKTAWRSHHWSQCWLSYSLMKWTRLHNDSAGMSKNISIKLLAAYLLHRCLSLQGLSVCQAGLFQSSNCVTLITTEMMLMIACYTVASYRNCDIKWLELNEKSSI